MRFLFRPKQVSKKHLLIGVIVLSIIAVLLFLFRQEIYAGIVWFVDTLGYVGLFLVSLVMDLLIQPFGSGALVIMNTVAGKHVLLVGLAAGIGSCIGGYGGYMIGRRIQIERFEKICGAKNIRKTKKLFDRYGTWAVLAAGVLPVPYNVVCWTAGMYEMKQRYFILSCIVTRIPRFLVISLVGFLFFIV